MFGTLGIPELAIIFLILLMLFGAKKVPDLMKGLGEGIRSFKTGIREDRSEGNGHAKQTDSKPE